VVLERRGKRRRRKIGVLRAKRRIVCVERVRRKPMVVVVLGGDLRRLEVMCDEVVWCAPLRS